MSKVKNPSTSDVKQRHKRKGGGSKPHSSRGRIGTATIKKNVDAAARRANKRSEKAIRNNNIITELGGYFIPGIGAASGASRAANAPKYGGSGRVINYEERKVPRFKKKPIVSRMTGGQIIAKIYD